MQLNIITLPERKLLAKEEMNRVGVDAAYWPAITGPSTIKAISQSHKMIVLWAKEQGLKEIAIAEDDIIFTSLRGWKYFLEHKPTDFDLYIGGHYSGPHLEDNTVHHFTGLTLYMIHERFYDTLLYADERRNIDTQLCGLGKFVVCNPEVAKQRNGYSFHRKKVVNDDHYLAGRKFLMD